MSIKIEIEAANGADARQQMLDLLGVNSKPVWGIDPAKPGEDKSVVVTITNEGVADIQPPAELVQSGFEAQNKVTEEAPKTRKRRSQAEIAADNAKLDEQLNQEAKTGLTSTPAEETKATEETPAQDTTAAEEQAITAEMLTAKAVELGRAGKRDAVLATLEQQFGGATIAKKDGKPQLQPEQYQAVMDAFNAIA